MQNIIQQLLNNLLYPNKNELGDSFQKITDCEVVIAEITSFLDEQEVLSFFMLNKRLRTIAQKNKMIQIRVLTIRLNRTEQVLNVFTKFSNPENIFRRGNKLKYQYLYHMNWQHMVKTFPPFKQAILRKKQIQPISIEAGNEKKVEIEICKQILPCDKQILIPAPKLAGRMEEKKNTYNKEDIKMVVNELKFLMFFNPEKNSNKNEKTIDINELAKQGRFVFNQLSKNLCPVVHIKRIQNLIYGDVVQYI